MNPSEIRVFSGMSIFIGGALWFLMFSITKFELLSFDSLKALGTGISFTGAFWATYFTWAWKWPFTRKMLYRPNLNGTWIGEFTSDWENSLGEKNLPSPFVLVIRQKWFSQSIRAFTSQQKTESYAEVLVFDNSKGVKVLAY